MADISAGGAARELPPFDPGAEVRAEAATRFHEQAATRTGKIKLLKAGKVVDTPERMAKRVDRIRRHHAGEPVRGVPVAVPTPGSEAADAEGRTLEAIINSADFVDIRFLEAGVAAARAVGRVDIRDQTGRDVGYGTASLISGQLALTNHHVLPTADVARRSAIELNYQDGIDGQPLLSRLFGFDPDLFYLADQAHDFAIVAVAAPESELAGFGFNRLIDVEGKAVVGEFVTIVQHPNGRKKQVSSSPDCSPTPFPRSPSPRPGSPCPSRSSCGWERQPPPPPPPPPSPRRCLRLPPASGREAPADGGRARPVGVRRRPWGPRSTGRRRTGSWGRR